MTATWLAGSPATTADTPDEYVGSTECGISSKTCAEPVCLNGPDPAVVCIPGNHIGVNQLGWGTIAIWDFTFGSVGGVVCQFTANNNICGDDTSELWERFCGDTVLGNGDSWDRSQFTYVFIGGPALTTFVCDSNGFGTQGSVRHSI